MNTNTTPVLVFDEPVEYVDRNLATASWWDKYQIQPGTYPFRWVNINGSTWNPDPEVHTPGFIANVGPYYAHVVLEVRLVESYRENRLLREVTSERRTHDEATTITRSLYAYQVPGCPKGTRRPVTEFMGGRIVAPANVDA